MALTRIHHIGIAVEDADEAGKLWQDVFGLEVALDTELQAQGVRGVIFPLDNCEIELLQPTRPDTGIAKFIETNGAGFHHICFESTDVAADLRAAAASGMEMIDTEPRQGLTGMIGFIHPRENHGVLVEFAQPPADAPRHMGPSGDASPHALHHMTVAVHDVDGVRDELAAKYGMAATRRGSERGAGDRRAVHASGRDRHRAGDGPAGRSGGAATASAAARRGNVHGGADGARSGGGGGDAARARDHGDGRRAGRVHLAAEHLSDEAAALGRVGTRTASRSGAMWPRSQRLA